MAPRATMRADHGTVCRPPRRTRGLRRGSVGSTPIPCRCGVGGGVVAEYEGMRGEAPCARVPAAGRRVRPAVRGPPRRRVGARPGATGPADLGSARARPGRPGASARRLGARPVVRRGGGSRTRRSGRSSFRPPTGPSSTARSTLLHPAERARSTTGRPPAAWGPVAANPPRRHALARAERLQVRDLARRRFVRPSTIPLLQAWSQPHPATRGRRQGATRKPDDAPLAAARCASEDSPAEQHLGSSGFPTEHQRLTVHAGAASAGALLARPTLSESPDGVRTGALEHAPRSSWRRRRSRPARAWSDNAWAPDIVSRLGETRGYPPRRSERAVARACRRCAARGSSGSARIIWR